jgi:hypothetical protein
MKRGGRRRARGPGVQWEPIRNFADACVTALAVHAQLGRARAAFVMDDVGTVKQGWALTGPEHTLGDALHLALLGPRDEIVGGHVLLVTAHGDDDISVLAEDDVASWHRLQGTIESRGARALDWVQYGGELFRSLRLSVEPDAGWPTLGRGGLRASP